MGRAKVYKHGREQIGVYLNPEEFEEFEKIRWREHMEKTDLGRKAILEYIKNHGSGNDTFKLDNWRDNPDFQAVPTILSRPEIWFQYLESCSPQERLNIQIKSVFLTKQCKDISNGTVKRRDK